MVSLAQLVRASDCGSEGRGFDPHTSPSQSDSLSESLFSFPHPTPPPRTHPHGPAHRAPTFRHHNPRGRPRRAHILPHVAPRLASGWSGWPTAHPPAAHPHGHGPPRTHLPPPVVQRPAAAYPHGSSRLGSCAEAEAEAERVVPFCTCCELMLACRRVRGSRWRGWMGRGSGPSWRGLGCGSGWLRARGRR